MRRWPDADQLEAFCRTASNHNLGAFLLFTGKDRLPEAWRERFAAEYVNASAISLIEEHRLQTLYHQLEDAGIRFAPFKGADLAFRIYPAPELRPHVDWDLFIHPDDFERAVTLLDKLEWRARYIMRPGAHHSTRLRQDAFGVEPHFTLPRFNATDAGELWHYIYPAENSRYRHVLSPELNLLMLCRHTSGDNYKHVFWGKLLLDIGFLLKKEKVDWLELKAMCERWQLPYPGDIMGAFPEFFSAKLLTECLANPETAELYRLIFEKSSQLMTQKHADWVCSETNFFSPSWWLAHLRGITPSVIRAKYSLPASGAYLRLTWMLIVDITLKFGGLCRGLMRPKRELLEYIKLVKDTDKARR
ncbi:MAG: nucleotidyltransferase family protein [Victivallaceae bacterium]|nr:nucleotidyltransferase family protein [Victivallaceae bacterium]